MLEWLKQHCPNLIPIEDKLGVDFATVCEALDVGYQIQTGCVIIRQMFPWLLVRIQDISKSSCKPPGKVFQRVCMYRMKMYLCKLHEVKNAS